MTEPLHERTGNRLRELAAIFAWLLHPLQAYDAAHEINDDTPGGDR